MDRLLDFAQITGLLIASAGLFLNALQIARSRKERRVEYVTRFLERLSDQPDLNNTYHEIERHELKYPLEGEKEKKVDKLLGELDHLAKLYVMKLIKADELNFFWYHILAVYQNPSIKKYIDEVDHTFRRSGLDRKPVEHFREVARMLEGRYGNVQPWRA